MGRRAHGKAKGWENEFCEWLRPWREARLAVHGVLSKQLEQPSSSQRFQTGELARALGDELRKPARVATHLPPLHAYWLLTDSPWAGRLGFKAALTWHRAEMKACGLAESFDPLRSQSGDDAATELLFRLSSLCAWIEAEDSFGYWSLSRQPFGQRQTANPCARARTTAASILARLWPPSDGLSAETFGAVWFDFSTEKQNAPGLLSRCEIRSAKQWSALLRDAERIARSRWEPLQSDVWVWSLFPIFRRYSWSAREVHRAASKIVNEPGDEFTFRRKWIERGLRFTGRKAKRELPPLWQFVINASPPKALRPGVVVW